MCKDVSSRVGDSVNGKRPLEISVAGCKGYFVANAKFSSLSSLLINHAKLADVNGATAVVRAAELRNLDPIEVCSCRTEPTLRTSTTT
jgi:hypothetical protein